MGKTDILIVGTVSNVEKSLQSDIGKLNSSFSPFANLSWFLVESDSNDKTVSILQSLKESSDCFEFVSLGILKNDFPLRTERLAFCRNKYLEYFHSVSKLKKITYLVVSDFDLTNSRLDSKSVSSCLNLSGWIALFATQRYFYYDLWALRNQTFCPYDVHAKIDELIKSGSKLRRIYLTEVLVRMFRISRNTGLMKVNSAFGGLAIYKADIIQLKSQYIGKSLTGLEICEHLSFNSSLAEIDSNLYINFNFVNHFINNRTWQAIIKTIIYFVIPNRMAIAIHKSRGR